MRALMRTSLSVRFLMAGLAALCLQLLLMLQGAMAAVAGHEEPVASAGWSRMQALAASAGGHATGSLRHGDGRHCPADPEGTCCDRPHDVAWHVIWRSGARGLPRSKGKGLESGDGAAGHNAPVFLTVDDFLLLSAGRIPPFLAFEIGRNGRGLLHFCCRLLI